VLPSVGDKTPKFRNCVVLQLSSEHIEYANFGRNVIWLINTAATAVPLTAHPIMVAVRNRALQ